MPLYVVFVVLHKTQNIRPDASLMLGQRPRRWPNIKPTSGGCLVNIFRYIRN